MNDQFRYSGEKAVYAGLVVDIAEEGFAEVQKQLAGIPGGAKKAIGSALSRAAAAGKTIAKREVVAEYFISQREFLAQTKDINRFKRSSNGDLTIVFGFRGNVIPLIKFNTKISKDGRVSTSVKRSSAPQLLQHAFSAQVGKHTGIFERIGKSRFPINEFYGPATPQMMYANEDVMDTIEGKIAETYENRIDHEITRILNGWGR